MAITEVTSLKNNRVELPLPSKERGANSSILFEMNEIKLQNDCTTGHKLCSKFKSLFYH